MSTNLNYGYPNSKNEEYKFGSKANKFSSGRSIGCYNCGEDGHYSRDCTKKRSQKKDQNVSLEFPEYVGQKLHCLPIELDDGNQSNSPSEANVGILTYLNKNESEIPSSGYSCILKHLVSDFNVNEINPEGKVLYLTDEDVPSCDAKMYLCETLESIKYPTYNELEESIKKWITPTFWNRLLVMSKKMCIPGEFEKNVYKNEISRLDVTGSEKYERKELHTWFKSQFPFVISEGAIEHMDDPDKKYIVLSYAKRENFRMAESDKWIKDWPRDREEKFLHFTLYKQAYDQAELFNCLTQTLIGNNYFNRNTKRSLKNSKYCFKYAGNKDKRGRTCQRISIKHVMAASIKNAVKKVNERNRSRFIHGDKIAVGNFMYQNHSIDLGDLKGNRFTIVLRDFHIDKSMEIDNGIENEIPDGKIDVKVAKAMFSLTKKGFINYFGLQRFGNTAYPNTSDVGLAMIKQDWKKVVELILYPRRKERPLMKKARAHWWMYRNAKDAYNILLRDNANSLEKILLKGLSENHENDIMGALCKLPRSSLMLYMHAYQALVWNKVVSRRINVFGEKVLVGDIVLMPEGVLGNLPDEEPMSEDENTAPIDMPSDQENDEKINQDSEVYRAQMSFNRLETKKRKLSYVTEETINDFTLENVQMVVPGHGVSYPKNAELKQMYLDVMKEDGLEDGFPDLRNVTSKNFSLTGDYRKLIGKPMDLEYQLIRYSEPNEDLLLKPSEESKLKDVITSKNEGPHLALVIAMSLQSSEYVTMAIREITRMDTGITTQSRLTQKHQENSCNNSGTKRSIDVTDEKIENEVKLLKREETE